MCQYLRITHILQNSTPYLDRSFSNIETSLFCKICSKSLLLWNYALIFFFFSSFLLCSVLISFSFGLFDWNLLKKITTWIVGFKIRVCKACNTKSYLLILLKNLMRSSFHNIWNSYMWILYKLWEKYFIKLFYGIVLFCV